MKSLLAGLGLLMCVALFGCDRAPAWAGGDGDTETSTGTSEGGPPFEMSTDDDTATSGTDDTEPCQADGSQGCVDGNIYWFDSCGEQGSLAEDCTGQNRICDDTAETVECACANGRTGANCDGCLLGWYGEDCTECRRFVVGERITPGDGLTWGTAFNEIQAAITAAHEFIGSSGAPSCEIWVSKGRYDIFDGDSAGNWFIDLKANLSLVGGFQVGAETREERDLKTDLSRLHGVFPWGSETAPEGISAMVHLWEHTELDSFVLSGSVGVPAVWVSGTEVTVRNNVFLGNTNSWGGGAIAAVQNNKLTIDRCQFYQNGGHPLVPDDGTEWGGAVFIYGGPTADVFISNSLFVNNHDDWGGAILQNDGDVDYTNCLFAANHATAVYPGKSWTGAAISVDSGTASVINSTFYNHEFAIPDGSFILHNKAIIFQWPATLNLVNSIVRDASEAEPTIDPVDLDASIFHSNVQGVDTTQNGNIDDDSCFAANPGPGGVTITSAALDDDTLQSAISVSETFAAHELAGMFLARVRADRSEFERWVYIIDNTEQELTVWGHASNTLLPSGSTWADESFEIHDLRLAAGSPCVDEGTANGAPSDDLTGAPRDAAPDMGAFEF